MIPRCGAEDCPNPRLPGAVHCRTHTEVDHARRYERDASQRVIGGDAGPLIVGVSIERVTDDDGDWRLP